MSDVREQVRGWLNGHTNLWGAELDQEVDDFLEKFEVTVKPEPPVISVEELGHMARVAVAMAWATEEGQGKCLVRLLDERGLEIVRKEVAE